MHNSEKKHKLRIVVKRGHLAYLESFRKNGAKYFMSVSSILQLMPLLIYRHGTLTTSVAITNEHSITQHKRKCALSRF